MRPLITPLVLLTASCGGDDPFSPTIENVAGSNGLHGNAGRRHHQPVEPWCVPGDSPEGLGEGGENIDVDLSGTWALQGDAVTFEQPGDTFVRDVPFVASRNQLQAEDTFGTVLIRVTLTK